MPGTQDSSKGTKAFSRHPGYAASNGVIDFTEKAGWNIWKMATAPLQDEPYDCKPEGFYQFIKSLKGRANLFGWSSENGILHVAPDPAKPNDKKHLLEDYGVFSYERIVAHELTYFRGDTRKAQDNCMLYICLMNSLSTAGKAKLNIHDNQFVIGTPPLESGLCLLKILIRESHLDSNATSSMIRTKMTNLDEYLEEVNNDIVEFNSHVQMLIDSLAARGETTHDLMTNLFKAYAACSDSTFVRYIADIQTKWEEGEDVTYQKLMERAANKYKIMKTKKVWEALSAEQEKLIALQAQLTSINKKYESKKEKLERLKKRKNDKKSDGEKSQKKGKTKKPAWFFKRPKDADLHKPREWNGYTWHFCSPETGGKCDGVYRIHKPSECKSKKKATDVEQPKDDKGGKSKSVTIKEAIAKMQEDDEDTLMTSDSEGSVNDE